jgi:hypothetical protein
MFGLEVIIVAPGTVATPIWDRADAADIAPFIGTPYAGALEKLRVFMVTNGKKGLRPEHLGEVVKTALTTARPKIRYTVTPRPLQNLLLNLLPRRWVDHMIARRLGLKYPRS